MAYRTKLTPETAEAIVNSIRLGEHPQTAFSKNGISYRSWYNWKQRAKAGEEPYAAFFAKIDVADGQAESMHFMSVVLAAKNDPKYAAWILERRWPKRWAQKLRVEMQEVEQLWMGALERVLGDPNVIARIRAGEDGSVVLQAFCEELARVDGPEPSGVDPGEPEPEPVEH